MFKELFEKVLEAGKDREYVPASLYPRVFTKKQRQVIEKLIELQKKYRELQNELNRLKAQKGELEPVIIKTLEKLKVNGVKLEKILLYLKEYHSAPSFKEVFAAVESQLTPKIAKLLTDAYKQLKKEKSGKSLVVQFKESQELTEDMKAIWQKVVNWFKDKFSKAVDSIGNTLDKILNLAKAKAEEAEEKGEVVVKGSQLGWGIDKPLASATEAIEEEEYDEDEDEDYDDYDEDEEGDLLEVLKDKLEHKLVRAISNAIEIAEECKNLADEIGGEVSRVVGGQLEYYTIPTLDSFLNDEHQPGSVESLMRFLNEELEEKKEKDLKESADEDDEDYGNKKDRGIEKEGIMGEYEVGGMDVI